MDGSLLLIDAVTVRFRIQQLAHKLHLVLHENVVISPVLEGGMCLWKRIAHFLPSSLLVVPIKAMSYRDNTTPSDLVLETPNDMPIKKRRIILFDDIMDTGGTLLAAREMLYKKGASDVFLTCLLDKPSRRLHTISPQLYGFSIPNVFVFGCGMDWKGRYREMDEIRYLPEE